MNENNEKKNCFICGKLDHFANQCRRRQRNGNPPKSNANLVEGDDVVAVVVAEVNMIYVVRNWVVDSNVTKHICGDKNVFTSYSSAREIEELLYFGDYSTALVHGKEKLLFKLTFEKTLDL